MSRKKNFHRECCDNYTLTFNDDESGVVWTTGNLNRFLRTLWNANPILRELNPDRTAKAFALRMSIRMFDSLYRSEKKGRHNANFYLVPLTASDLHRKL